MRTDIEESVTSTWERTFDPHGPEHDDLRPWVPGDGFPDGNDPLRRASAPHGLDGEDDEAPALFWEDPPRSDGR
ncbi:hypothetical protein [Archangium lipolyticum]|uniref:hypothetical protein n=1 Tax=Archangium lipolyticum TaxID=2970465 RepID=UPI00214A4D34|nr:hypothetical protein [Archangium lipolyticum]